MPLLMEGTVVIELCVVRTRIDLGFLRDTLRLVEGGADSLQAVLCRERECGLGFLRLHSAGLFHESSDTLLLAGEDRGILVGIG